LEIAYINENYQKLYSPIISEIEKLQGNTLVLFDRIEFGQNMYELTKNFLSMRNVMYIDGQTNIKERELARQTLEKNSDNILFGQCSILSTGINIKNLTNLVMMVSTKSFSRILQSIGRTLRLHKDKDVAKLYDLSFNFKYSQKHLGERLAIYKKMYKKTPDSSKIIPV
jgi:superfamily II DNA or RNA helicase